MWNENEDPRMWSAQGPLQKRHLIKNFERYVPLIYIRRVVPVNDDAKCD